MLPRTNFTDEIERKLSPQRHISKLHAPVALVYSTAETPEFQRQARDFAAAVKTAGKDVSLTVMEGYNHFEVMEQLANGRGPSLLEGRLQDWKRKWLRHIMGAALPVLA